MKAKYTNHRDIIKANLPDSANWKRICKAHTYLAEEVRDSFLNSSFCVKDTYNLLRDSSPILFSTRYTWNKLLPGKIRLFQWKIINGCFPFPETLRTMNYNIPSRWAKVERRDNVKTIPFPMVDLLLEEQLERDSTSLLARIPLMGNMEILLCTHKTLDDEGKWSGGYWTQWMLLPYRSFALLRRSPTPVIQLHAKTHFPIKLVTTNFPIWQRQVRSTLVGLGLLGYVDGTLPSPPQVVDGAANPCNIIWFCQDQAIVGALLGSCTDIIQPLISNVSTTRDAWLNLHSSFTSASRGHVLALKSKLGKNPRGNRSINDYLHEMHSIANELALNQSPIAEEDLVVHVLNQLGTKYDPIASAAYIRGSTLPFTELGDILQDFERKLKLMEEATSSIVATAHAAQCHHSHGSRTYGGPVARSSSHSSRPSANQRPQHGASKSFHRHDGMSSSCQFCSIPGHDIKVCRKLARLLGTTGCKPCRHRRTVSRLQ
ncbi:hypothetical protein DM860_012996 [Cuscuta australis]|uniref:Reverse transcriptase zinc-binding domain-containing protein n=1 Tax=Cuscuta australis TaxID=267555 RepID=A0A328D232_9ASTE|nr:hypothetical protein DM860_012996 [Cuscuta australis]